MLKNNDLRLKLKIRHSNYAGGPSTPLTPNPNIVFNLNSPVQNNKFNFNFLFWKDNHNNKNKIPIQFNNNLVKNEKYNDNSKNNNIQKNLNDEFEKVHIAQVNNKIKENIQKTEEKQRKIKPVFQNILAANKINRELPKMKNNLISNHILPIKEENEHNKNSKSNNVLPLVKKGLKKIINKSRTKNNKNLLHNKSGNNIKINIDCAIKKKLDENKEINPENINNNLFIQKISGDKQNFINDKNKKNINENNLAKMEEDPLVTNKKLIDFFYKEEQNLKYKKEMEDFILVKNSFLNTQNHYLSLFGIFDGHGGGQVAEYLKNNFPDVLAKIITENPNHNKDYSEIINIAIQAIDKDLEKVDNVKECGSTGTVVLIDNDSIYCANVGDSKCFFINDKEAIQMTEDHNCKNKSEVEAIRQKGVKVFNGRVLGCLALTRTFGDTDYKEFQISCEPYITKISINKDNIKYIVIASDGVWDVVNEEQLFKIQNKLKSGSSEEFCNSLINYSLKGDSHDNISCIVLKFGE